MGEKMERHTRSLVERLSGKTQPDDIALPFEVIIRGRNGKPAVKFGRGVKLSTVIAAAERWYRIASDQFRPNDLRREQFSAISKATTQERADG